MTKTELLMQSKTPVVSCPADDGQSVFQRCISSFSKPTDLAPGSHCLGQILGHGVESGLAGELTYHVSNCRCLADRGRKRRTMGESCASGGAMHLGGGVRESISWSGERSSGKEGAGSCLKAGKLQRFQRSSWFQFKMSLSSRFSA